MYKTSHTQFNNCLFENELIIKISFQRQWLSKLSKFRVLEPWWTNFLPAFPNPSSHLFLVFPLGLTLFLHSHDQYSGLRPRFLHIWIQKQPLALVPSMHSMSHHQLSSHQASSGNLYSNASLHKLKSALMTCSSKLSCISEPQFFSSVNMRIIRLKEIVSIFNHATHILFIIYIHTYLLFYFHCYYFMTPIFVNLPLVCSRPFIVWPPSPLSAPPYLQCHPFHTPVLTIMHPSFSSDSLLTKPQTHHAALTCVIP